MLRLRAPESALHNAQHVSGVARVANLDKKTIRQMNISRWRKPPHHKR
jgi:hypothetical protein